MNNMDAESMEVFDKVLGKLDKIDNRLDGIDNRLDKIEDRLDKAEFRLDKIDNRLDIMEIKQNKMSEQITELQLAQKRFELNANKKFARLQDGMDAVEEILRINELIR